MCVLCLSVQGAVFLALDLVQSSALEQGPSPDYLWPFYGALHCVAWMYPSEDNALPCPELWFEMPVKKNPFCPSHNILPNSFLGAYSLKYCQASFCSALHSSFSLENYQYCSCLGLFPGLGCACMPSYAAPLDSHDCVGFQMLQSRRQLACGGTAAKVGSTAYLQVLHLEITCYRWEELGLTLLVALPDCARAWCCCGSYNLRLCNEAAKNFLLFPVTCLSCCVHEAASTRRVRLCQPLF